MGNFLNPGNQRFASYAKLDRYVDKSRLLAILNRFYEDPTQKFVCVSRPRRFGKSVTAGMICAYYSKEADSREIFDQLAIADDPSYLQHLNQHNVIAIDMQLMFKNADSDVTRMLKNIDAFVLKELQSAGFDFNFGAYSQLNVALRDFEARFSQEHFIFVIDEWDCIFRERKYDQDAIKLFLSYLLTLFKEQSYVSLVYMTGILPIKKYGTQSALNMFDEFSMTEPDCFAAYMGFTEPEVLTLCEKNSMDFALMRQWYDGYSFDDCPHVYNPNSVIKAVCRRKFSNYWSKTETYVALQDCIDLNFDGLRDAVTRLMAGEELPVITTKFQNDMVSFSSSDDVLTLMVHLGYLAIRTENLPDGSSRQYVRIPNREIRAEFENSIADNRNFQPLADAIKSSESLLENIWKQNASAVAHAFDVAHQDGTSILEYNNERDLCAVVSLAMYSSINSYTVIREMPAGKGFADLVYLPRPGVDKPALIVELKYNHSAQSAINQILERNYPNALKAYAGNMLLAGISYDRKNKTHQCVIERAFKQH